MKKIIFLFLTLPFLGLLAQEQKIEVTPVSVQKIDADLFVGFDGLGSCYYIKNNVFIKKNKDNVWQYKNVALGTISKIDLQNPLNLVLFYENFNTAVMLDNQLNETQIINFSKNDTSTLVTATGIASQNRLWIYNSLSQQIGFYYYLKNSVQMFSNSFAGNLKHYESDFTTFQWIDENLNWYSCDAFGKISTLGKVPDFDQIQLISNAAFIYKKNNSLYYFNFIDNKYYFIDLKEKTFENFYYKDQIISIFTDQEIRNYKIITP